MKIIRTDYPPVGYSPRSAAKAFDPPASAEAIRRSIRLGLIKTVRVGARGYITRNELLRAAEAGEIR